MWKPSRNLIPAGVVEPGTAAAGLWIPHTHNSCVCVCVCVCVWSTRVSGGTHGALHPPGLSIQAAALSEGELPVQDQRSGAHHLLSHRLPADALVVRGIFLILFCTRREEHRDVTVGRVPGLPIKPAEENHWMTTVWQSFNQRHQKKKKKSK